MPNTSESALESRTTPVQRRGVARVDALLDAAAGIVEESGIVAMTTSAIAERSGSSVGVVYRYFPNAEAVLVALATRNRDRFMSRVLERFTDARPTDWIAFAGLCVEVYAELGMSIPGFRTVRFGDVVVLRFRNHEASSIEELAALFDSLLVEHYGFTRTEELEFATQLAMECADAVTRRAFLRSSQGDARFIEAATGLIIAILAPHAPDARSATEP